MLLWLSFHLKASVCFRHSIRQVVVFKIHLMETFWLSFRLKASVCFRHSIRQVFFFKIHLMETF